jgi:murein DD-endopeptidase MepM/ murein hydrolase activator NlpD
MGVLPGKRLSPEDWAGRLSIYAYTTHADDAVDDTVQDIAARCGVTQESIASLNRINHSVGLGEQIMLLPTVSGIFVPLEPASDMERLLLSARDIGESAVVTIAGTAYLFFPGQQFSPTERAFFLAGGRFRFPLRDYTLTSSFGSRVSPISGTVRFHGGLDLAAPMGTDVYASGDGTVIECGENSIYGKFIIIRHDGLWTSLYGHLSAVNVKQGDRVGTGKIVGKVGSTGQSTGPHLHFELRENGRAQNPSPLLKK